MVYVLFAAVAAGAAIGAARSFSGSPTPAVEPAPAAIAADPGAPADEAAPPGVEATAAIEGQVLEIIQVPNYSYLRIGAPGSEGTWAAVPTASLAVGDPARIHDGMRIENFASTALKRTFPVIYFGTLEGGDSTHGMAAANARDPHAKGALPGATGDDADEMKAAHPPLGAIDVKPVERAKGPDARTVAELIAERTKLVGKTVRIHATVVKATPGVLGRTFLHLRDGSGDPAKGTHDVVVTTTSTPQVGDTIVVEGTVAIDRDIGAGYKFPTIVEDAKVLPQP